MVALVELDGAPGCSSTQQEPLMCLLGVLVARCSHPRLAEGYLERGARRAGQRTRHRL
jgi:hypothetical protein